MLHHLFKNAAPGSNAAIWRGLFYKEWLHSKPVYWIPLILWAVTAFFWTEAANPNHSFLVWIWLMVMTYAHSREDENTQEFSLILPVSACKQMLARTIYHSGPLFATLAIMIFTYYLDAGHGVLAWISNDTRTWNPQPFEIQHLPQLITPFFLFSLYSFTHASHEESKIDIALILGTLWFSDLLGKALGFTPELFKASMMFMVIFYIYAIRIWTSRHALLQVNDRPTKFYSLKTLNIDESRRQFFVNLVLKMRSWEPRRALIRKWGLREPQSEGSSRSTLWRGLILRESEISPPWLTWLGLIWIVILFKEPMAHNPGLLFTALFGLIILFSVTSKVDSSEEFMLCQAPTWRKQMQAQILINLIPFAMFGGLATMAHVLFYPAKTLSAAYFLPCLLCYMSSGRQFCFWNASSILTSLGYVLLFISISLGVSTVGMIPWLPGMFILGLTQACLYWSLIRQISRYQYNLPPMKTPNYKH
ncbi:MAG: hypothetical protein RL095_3814 [Verrucomicrobiota bacterium]|jgi:hypothetical protein